MRMLIEIVRQSLATLWAHKLRIEVLELRRHQFEPGRPHAIGGSVHVMIARIGFP